jgi:hypothetical protein
MPHARASRQLQPNRADLTQPSAQAVPNQPYGVAAAQRAAAQAIPMGQPPLGAAPTQTPPQAQPQAPTQPLAVPGGNGPLSRPTERPNEPVTHGLPMGPGAGPEALQGVGAAARQGAVEQGTLTHLLTSLAAQPNATSAIKDLAARAQGGAM